MYKSNKPFPKGLVITYQAATNAGMYVIVLESTGTKIAVNPSDKTTVTWGMLKKREK